MIKKTALLLFLILSATLGRSQFYKSLLPSTEFTSALEKIVLDFRLNYKTIQGDPVNKEGNVETFESIIKIPGAKECIITKFNSVIDTSASWQALMYSGDDYNKAVKTYENVFRLVKKSQVKWIDRSSVGFAGEMEKPKEEIRFTVSTLHFEIDDPRYENFLAEVEIVPSLEGWEVRLNLHSKGSDAENKALY